MQVKKEKSLLSDAVDMLHTSVCLMYPDGMLRAFVAAAAGSCLLRKSFVVAIFPSVILIHNSKHVQWFMYLKII